MSLNVSLADSREIGNKPELYVKLLDCTLVLNDAIHSTVSLEALVHWHNQSCLDTKKSQLKKQHGE